MNPPRLAKQLLAALLRPELLEEVLGDLDEKFARQAEIRPAWLAVLNYWYQVFNYLRPFAIRRINYRSQPNTIMVQSYLKVGWRNLLKDKTHAAINIGGLAMGMAVAMMIGLWIHDELTFNHHHGHHARIAHVLRNGTLNGETFTSTYQSVPLADELRTRYGNFFSRVSIVFGFDEHMISREEGHLAAKGMYTELGMVDMLSLQIINGSARAFHDAHAVLISRSLAKALFGEGDPVDKDVRINNTLEAKVIGVYEDLPSNSTFSGCKFLASWNMFVSRNEWVKYQNYNNNLLDVYAELGEGVTFDNAGDAIKDVVLKQVGSNKEYVAANPQLILHPMDQWHLWNEFRNGSVSGGLIQFVWMFGIVGIFVLLLACINFMNLSTAKSGRRAREVGIRKAMGSLKSQLVRQFFSEAFVVVVMATMISLVLVGVSLPYFNFIAAKGIVMPWTNIFFWEILGGFMLITTLLSGSYPALYLSSFEAVTVLKGVFRAGQAAGSFRRALVIVQFTVSVTLVIGTVVVFQQIQYARQRDAGYDHQQLLMVSITSPEFVKNMDALRNELKKTGVVDEIAQSGGRITTVWSSQGGFSWAGKDPAQQIEFATLAVAPEYGKTVGWQFVEGRDFSRNRASDSTGFVITESAARVFGIKEVVGSYVHWEPGWRTGGDYQIIGVVKDIVMDSPFGNAMPTVYFIDGYTEGVLNIRLNPGVSGGSALTTVQSVLNDVMPGVASDIRFADSEYNNKFVSEERIGKLASVFAILAIGISCLGLTGLASYVAEQRVKEMSIRKVMGASGMVIWKLFSKDFLLLVLIASFAAIPISWYFLNSWLEQYHYHTSISIWLYVSTSAGALLLALTTISLQTIKIVLVNPSRTLKSE